VIPATQESLIRLSTSFARFEQVAPKAERAFDEVSALARASREVVPEFRQTNIRLQELIGGNEPSDMRNPDAPQPTLRTAMREISDLLRTIRPAADEIAAVLKDTGPEINQTVRSVRRTSDSVNELLNAENRKAVSATLKNFQAASDDLTKTIRLTAILLSGAEDTVKQLNARLAQSEAVLSNIGKATKPVADNADQIVKDIAETARTINAATTELAKTLSEVRIVVQRAAAGAGEGGTLQKVLTDPSLYNNLNDAAVTTARLIARAEKVAKDLEVFADKIARKPETIGLGGVVHPSTGLKESPNAPIPYSTPLLPFAPAPGPTGPGPRVWPPVTQPVAAPSGEGPLTPIPPLSRDSGVVPSYKPVARPDDLPRR
jgi:phospholipid/cholesterol/gamma-HCH transport system substrate-binding protein